jgi:hypothetical protein
MKFKYFALQEMIYFGNYNLAPYTVTPAQSPDGKFFIFFGSISQELTFNGLTPVNTFTPMTVTARLID